MKSKIAFMGAVALIAAVAVAQDATKSVWDGVYTEAQAKTGQANYNSLCASCHGDQLNGGEMAPPLAGGEFMSNWNGLTVGDLYERIRTTMPPGDPGKVGRDDKVAIISYILQYNKFPAGSTELPNQAEVLRQIQIQAEKGKK